MAFEINYDIKAPVFNIQTYCIHDGPGIRDTVFVKGCPLRCLWCSNPESNLAKPQLMTYSSKCTGCGECIDACPNKAISIGQNAEGKYIALTDRTKCTDCGECVQNCSHNAREISGKDMSVRECIDKVKRDKLFFTESGGGLTISGGEVLAHADFSANLLAAAKELGIHTCVESSSFAPREVIDKVFQFVDLALLDVKHIDDELHKKFTGVSNKQILDNIKHIYKDLHVDVIIRVPVIPGCNDSDENIKATALFARSLGENVLVNLLPGHKLGESKNESLGVETKLAVEVPSAEHMEHLKEIVEGVGQPCKIGG